MNVRPKILTINYHVAECPICGEREIWIDADLRKEAHKCQSCFIVCDTDVWPRDEIGTAKITLAEDEVFVQDD